MHDTWHRVTSSRPPPAGAVTNESISSLTITSKVVTASCFLTVTGVLDSTTYLPLRNAIIKAALDEPQAVVVDVTDLVVPTETALAVFTSASWHIRRWPDVPLMLVCEHARGRESLRRNGITRCATVHDCFESAEIALSLAASARGRRRARIELSPSPGSLNQARLFANDCFASWDTLELLPTANVVITALLENAFQHTSGRASLRLETNGEAVTVAIEDTSTAFAGVRERPEGEELSSLQIIDALCRMWGNAPTPAGKTVWAVVGPENRL